MQYTVLVTEGLEDKPLNWLKEHAHVVECSPRDVATFDHQLALADALIVRTYTQVDKQLLAKAPRLRVVGRAGVGLENIDQEACAARSIHVISTPSANTHAVVEYVFNLIFHLGRPLVNLAVPIPPEEFHRFRKTVRGLELFGKNLGILGMGRIGTAVGRVAHAFGMNILYNDIIDVSGNVDYPARSVAKEALYADSDILTIHVSHRPGNRHLINGNSLMQFRPHTILVNTSRGEVVDAAAVALSLRQGRLGAAALDVHEPEPPPIDYPLWGAPNLILAPHLAARTQGAMDAMSWVARDVVEFLSHMS